ncbi:hypothetical protein CANCADRAFT_27588 [Tortispora caseinolytica NRRL Y-17796]|uniref:Amino acid transporter transmembrane domain-containing protein n=1 Tax=Tortispora caseinolytica NRRL Y-17796 TaxID=767744 RepID=A0A1E4TBR5_9ASCO|nr:hypothetical protein CANCADRAFT_27588 [Tortispora caseinolytica NRRL Y-17796]
MADPTLEPNASAKSCIVNLLNTVLGAGMLAMPYAFSCNGVALGLVVLILSALASATGLYLQSRCAIYVEQGQASFFSLAQITYPSLGVLFDIAIAIKCFGVGVSYLIIVGDLMPQVTGTEFLSRAGWISVALVVLLPLCYMRRIDSLRYSSILAMASALYLVCLVVVHYALADIDPDLRGPVSMTQPRGLLDVLRALPIIVFAYTCHQNMFSITNEIKDRSQNNLIRVVVSTIGTACAVYITIGLSGYFTYGDYVTGNIVAMYPPSISSTIARLAMCILVLLGYPLQCHPCRASLNHIIYHIRTKSSSESPPTPAAPPMPTFTFIGLTTLILSLSYITALSVSSLAKVLGIVGATGSTSISFILPGLFAHKILRRPPPDFKPTDSPVSTRPLPPHQLHGANSNARPSSRSRLLDSLNPLRNATNRQLRSVALFLSVWGVIVMIVSLTAAFI